MNRIDQKFQDLRKLKKAAFIAFLTTGDPDLKTTEALALSFESAGVDILELGVPFSDPMADGPTIQAASQRALKNKVNLKQILELVARVRKTSQLPIALMSYYNPVFHYGVKKFVHDAKAAGVDGVIIPDLPPEEAKDLITEAKKADLSTVFFAAPTTTNDRLKGIVNAATGFIYYVSLAGVTGARQSLPQQIKKDVLRVKSITKKPVCVGFGISTAQQVKEIGAFSDGIIVGSAIIKEMEKHTGRKDLVKVVSSFVSNLSNALK